MSNEQRPNKFMGDDDEAAAIIEAMGRGNNAEQTEQKSLDRALASKLGAALDKARSAVLSQSEVEQLMDGFDRLAADDIRKTVEASGHQLPIRGSKGDMLRTLRRVLESGLRNLRQTEH